MFRLIRAWPYSSLFVSSLAFVEALMVMGRF